MSKIYDRITTILKARKISLTEIGENLHISASSFGRTLREQTLSVEKLESLSEYLNIHPSLWWIEDEEVFKVEEPRSKYNYAQKETNDEVIKSLLNQVSFLNNVVSEQLIIIKNLSKK